MPKMTDEGSPFMETDRLRNLFGARPGSEIETKITYIPTGKLGGRPSDRHLEVSGCRTFPASEYDWLVVWISRYAHQDLLALRIAGLLRGDLR